MFESARLSKRTSPKGQEFLARDVNLEVRGAEGIKNDIAKEACIPANRKINDGPGIDRKQSVYFKVNTKHKLQDMLKWNSRMSQGSGRIAELYCNI